MSVLADWPRQRALEAAATIRAMRYGICLPNFTDLASPEAIEAAADVAERLGWEAVWTTDHVLVDHSARAADYRIELRRDPDARLGRRAASRAAARDERHRRSAAECGRPRQGARDARCAHRRAAHRRCRRRLEPEGVREPRRGRPIPVAGRLPERDDRALAPPLVRIDRAVRRSVPLRSRRLRVQAAAAAGRGAADPRRRPTPSAALARAGRLGDGYHSSASGPEAYAKNASGDPRRRRGRRPADADAVGPGPGPVTATTDRPYYALRGSPEEIAAEIRRSFEKLGVEHLALAFPESHGAAMVLATRNASPRRPRSWSTRAGSPARDRERRSRRTRGARRRDPRGLRRLARSLRSRIRRSQNAEAMPIASVTSAPTISAAGTLHADAMTAHQQAAGRHGAREDRRVDAHHPAAELVRDRHLDRRVRRDGHRDRAGARR